MNLFLIIDLIAVKEAIVLRASLHKISSKFKKPKTNFKDETSSIIKMSKSELINSASEDKNYGTEESETVDEYLSEFTKLQRYMYEESVTENCQGKESTDSEEEASRIENTLWSSCDKYKPITTHAESICY